MISDDHRILAARKEGDSGEIGRNDTKSSRLMERMRDFVLKRPLAENVAVLAISAGAILGAVSCGGDPFEVGWGPNTTQDASTENEGGNKDVNLESEANDSGTDAIISDSDAGETSLDDNSVNDVIDTGKDIGDDTVIIQDTGNELIVPDVIEEPVNDSPNVDVVTDTSVEDGVSTDTNVQDVPADIIETSIDVFPEIGPEPVPEASVDTGPDITVNDVVNDPVAEESGPSPPWQYKVACTITTGLASGSDLSNFPAYCTLDSAGLIAAGKMRGDCYDLRVQDTTHGQLSYELEDGTCNSANTVIWLKLPLAKGGQGNQVNLLYGNPAAVNGQNASGVWSNGFSAVYHMGSLADSLGANNLTVHATAPTLVSSPCRYGNCYQFSDNGGFAVANNNLVNEAADFTWSAWGNASAYHTGANNESTFIGTDNGAHGIGLFFNPMNCMGTASSSKFAIYVANYDVLCSNTASSSNSAYQYALTHASSGAMNIMIDGVTDNSITYSTTDSATPFNIGYYNNMYGKYFQGTVDEVRLHNVVRSADWMKAEYSVTSTNGSEGPNN